jgi:hypothetical protein
MTGGWGIVGLWVFFNLIQSPNVSTVGGGICFIFSFTSFSPTVETVGEQNNIDVHLVSFKKRKLFFFLKVNLEGVIF